MNPSEARNLNELLRSVKTGTKNYSIAIDNIKSCYIELENEYILPPVPLDGIDSHTGISYLKAILPFIGNLLSDFQVLPIPWPKRELHKLVLANEVLIDEYKYIYMIKLDCAYLGGARANEIVTQATQKFTASVRTKKVFLSLSIIPVESIEKEKSQIIYFNPKIFVKEKLVQFEDLDSSRKKFISELFDEIDYSSTLEPLKKLLGINESNWKIGKIFEPLYFDNLVPTIRFLNLNHSENIKMFKKFHSILELEQIQETIGNNFLIEDFQKWLRLFRFERTLTPSGNIAWKIFYS